MGCPLCILIHCSGIILYFPLNPCILSSHFQPILWVAPAALCPSPHQRFPPSQLDSPRPTQPFQTMKSFRDSKTFRAQQALQSIPGACEGHFHTHVFSWRISSTTLDNTTYHTLSPAVGEFAGSTILHANRNPSTSIVTSTFACAVTSRQALQKLCSFLHHQDPFSAWSTLDYWDAHEDLYTEQVWDTLALAAASSTENCLNPQTRCFQSSSS